MLGILSPADVTCRQRAASIVEVRQRDLSEFHLRVKQTVQFPMHGRCRTRRSCAVYRLSESQTSSISMKTCEFGSDDDIFRSLLDCIVM